MTYSEPVRQESVCFALDWGVYGMLRLLSAHEFDSVLDIGSGAGEHKRMFEFFGKDVFSVDIRKDADYVGDFLELEFDRRFDAVWCSHVLEHQRNVGLFLDKVFDVLSDDGVLALTVPIHPPERLIAGHLTSWSIPLLCYNLVMAGFDCRDAELMSTFELTLLVRKKAAEHAERRASCAGGGGSGRELADIEAYFPFPARQGAEVRGAGAINWPSPFEYELPLPANRRPVPLAVISKNFLGNPHWVPKLTVRSTPVHGNGRT